MSRWTHVICGKCYAVKESGRTPVQVAQVLPEPCCFCGKQTNEGIYYRADPSSTQCSSGSHND